MNPSRFARLKEIFLTASSLPEEKRAAYLGEACRDDSDLRAEAERLLRREGEFPPSLRTGAMADRIKSRFGPAESPGPTRRMPDRIGPYRILGILGEGGMGIVYRVEQREPIRREAALKLIKTGMDTHGVTARFEAERQTLALMDHPHIAKVLDAGADEVGRPYFVMEMVRGIPLTDYCRANTLEVADRLRVFQSVCRAVQHAHQKGIIHRDLKPSNVLVAEQDGFPHAKIIDFGIAKAMAVETEARTALTREGQLVGTPDYMSPEQARGDAAKIDQRTDIYSLGMILYELISGRLPYDARKPSLLEAARVICEEPPRPLRRAEGARAEVDRDLETIVRKALEKEPDLRYASASALGDDIDRFLTSQPILARPPSTVYQLRKLVGRHKAPFAFAAALLVFVVLFGVAMAFLYEGQKRERRRAETEARKAERISEFLQGMLASPNPGIVGRDVTVLDILDRAAAELDSGLGGEPEVRAAVHHTLGVTYTALDRYDAADEQLDSARAIFEKAVGERAREVAGVMDDETYVLWRRGEYARAESLARISLEIHEAAGNVEGMAVSLNNLGSFLMEQRKLDDAEPLLRRSNELRREIYGETHEEVAVGLNQIAGLLYARGEPESAESLIRESLAIRRQLAGGRPTPAVAQSTQNLGVLLKIQGKYAEAEPLAREAVELYIGLFGEEHVEVAQAQSSHALLLEDLGDFEGSKRLQERSLATWRKHLGDEHPSVVGGLLALVKVCAALGEFEAAESHNDEALRIARRIQPGDYVFTIPALQNDGLFLQRKGRYAEAETRFRQAIEMGQRLHGGRHPAIAGALRRLAALRREEGNLGEAEAFSREALAMQEALLGAAHITAAATRIALALLVLDAGRAEEADSLLRVSLEALENALPEDHRETMLARNALGLCLAAEGKKQEAESHISACRGGLLAPPDAPIEEKRDALTRTAKLYEAWGEADRAAEYRAALRRLARDRGGEAPPI